MDSSDLFEFIDDSETGSHSGFPSLRSSNEEYSLLDVLADETLLSDMKQSESSSSGYFNQRETIEKLVHYIRQEDFEGVEDYNIYCYSRNAALLLCSSLSLSYEVVNDPELFGLICSMIDENSYSPHNALCFSMIIENFYRSQVDAVSAYLSDHRNVLDNMALHFDNLNIVRALFAIYTNTDEALLDFNWLTDHLLDGLHSLQSSDNCYAFLYKLIDVLSNDEMNKDSVFSRIFEELFASDSFKIAFENDLRTVQSLRDDHNQETDNGSYLLFRAMRRIIEQDHEEFQLPITLDDEEYSQDTVLHNTIHFDFKKPIYEAISRSYALIIEVMSCYSASEPIRSICPKSFVELLHLVQEAVCCNALNEMTPLEESFLEVYDKALSGSMICYSTSSFLHGHVKKIYKAMLNSQNPLIIKFMTEKSTIFDAIDSSSDLHIPAVIAVLNIYNRFYKMKDMQEEYRKGSKYASMLDKFDLEEIFKPLRKLNLENYPVISPSEHCITMEQLMMLINCSDKDSILRLFSQFGTLGSSDSQEDDEEPEVAAVEDAL